MSDTKTIKLIRCLLKTDDLKCLCTNSVNALLVSSTFNISQSFDLSSPTETHVYEDLTKKVSLLTFVYIY